jgi:uncharacterized membrane protein YfcA
MALSLSPSLWALLILTGCLAGLLCGLFGRKGGLAFAPALLIVLPACGVPPEALPRLAAASAIAALIPIAIAKAEAPLHWKIADWPLFALLGVSTAMGALLGTAVTASLDSRLLALLLAGSLIVLSLRLWRNAQGGSGCAERPAALPPVATTLKAIAAGAAAAIAGVSAGLVLAPLLTKALPPEKAETTASALTLPFALAAAAGYWLSPAPGSCGAACAGAIFLPAFAAAGMAAVIAAPLGAMLKPFLPQRTAHPLFAAAIIAGAILSGPSANTVLGLLTDSGEGAIELVLGPLCDPGPAPAAPSIGGGQDRQDRLAQGSGATAALIRDRTE